MQRELTINNIRQWLKGSKAESFDIHIDEENIIRINDEGYEEELEEEEEKNRNIHENCQELDDCYIRIKEVKQNSDWKESFRLGDYKEVFAELLDYDATRYTDWIKPNSLSILVAASGDEFPDTTMFSKYYVFANQPVFKPVICFQSRTGSTLCNPFSIPDNKLERIHFKVKYQLNFNTIFENPEDSPLYNENLTEVEIQLLDKDKHLIWGTYLNLTQNESSTPDKILPHTLPPIYCDSNTNKVYLPKYQPILPTMLEIPAHYFPNTYKLDWSIWPYKWYKLIEEEKEKFDPIMQDAPFSLTILAGCYLDDPNEEKFYIRGPANGDPVQEYINIPPFEYLSRIKKNEPTPCICFSWYNSTVKDRMIKEMKFAWGPNDTIYSHGATSIDCNIIGSTISEGGFKELNNFNWYLGDHYLLIPTIKKIQQTLTEEEKALMTLEYEQFISENFPGITTTNNNEPTETPMDEEP